MLCYAQILRAKFRRGKGIIQRSTVPIGKIVMKTGSLQPSLLFEVEWINNRVENKSVYIYITVNCSLSVSVLYTLVFIVYSEFQY